MPTPHTNRRDAAEISPMAVRRAALSDTLQHPLTIIPVAVGGVVSVAVALFALAPVSLALAIAVGGLLAGGTNFCLRFCLGHNALLRRHYQALHDEFLRLKERKVRELANELQAFDCARGQAQVAQLEERFQTLLAVFGRMFPEREVTYDAFVSSAEEAYRFGLSNLERIVVLRTNLRDIDLQAIRTRINGLEKRNRTAAEERELVALRDQARVAEESQQNIDGLLALNEEVLATMDQAGVAVLQIMDASMLQSPQERTRDSIELLRIMIDRAERESGTQTRGHAKGNEKAI